MHILAINASYRGDAGHTRFLLDLLLRGAQSSGASAEVLTLARHKLNRCLGCGHCETPENYLRCAYSERDDAAHIFEQMRAADLLIFATPIYQLGISVLLKNLLDRTYSTMDVSAMRLSQSGLFYHHRDDLSAKPFAALITCSNFEAATPRNLAQYFRLYARYNDAPLRGLLIRNTIDFFPMPGQPFEPLFPRIPSTLAAFSEAGRDLALGTMIRPAILRRANQEVIPAPAFRLIKHLRPVKNLVLARVEAMLPGE